MKLDRNQIIGLILLFGLFYLWSVMNAPTEEELAERKRVQDSLLVAQQELVDTIPDADTSNAITGTISDKEPVDTLAASARSARFGAFAPSSQGTEQRYNLENDVFTVEFSNKGGVVKNVELKHYAKLIQQEDHQNIEVPVRLLEDDKNEFSYLLPVAGAPGSIVKSSDLFYQVERTDDRIVFTAMGTGGLRFIQEYRIRPGSYTLDYRIRTEGTDQVLDPSATTLPLSWTNYLDKIEINEQYERYYSTVYFKLVEDDPDYCSCRKSDIEQVDEQDLKWISHSNQFFNSSLIAASQFGSGIMETKMLDEDSEDLKLLRTSVQISLDELKADGFAMEFYIGPNDFENLLAFHQELQDIIPFGSSIFGTINRWVVRPLFNALSGLMTSKGLVILLLTFIVKVLLYPLTYKMLYSQAKMAALKPELTGLKEKHKDDMQAQQMETMKKYREYGVSPLGGCMPMVMQMPIWFALYRFFPASIEFRQAEFLWAYDLSSYDAIAYLPFNIPMYGDHISLFTLLWAGTTLIYTYYNTKHMDMASINPMMKYMQYFMPVMFLFFFNGYASGLTLYLLYSNVLNILQTVGSRQFLFDEEKIREKLNLNKAKPKKKGGFQARLEQAMKEQQRVAREKGQAKRAKDKKR